MKLLPLKTEALGVHANCGGTIVQMEVEAMVRGPEERRSQLFWDGKAGAPRREWDEPDPDQMGDDGEWHEERSYLVACTGAERGMYCPLRFSSAVPHDNERFGVILAFEASDELEWRDDASVAVEIHNKDGVVTTQVVSAQQEEDNV